MRPKLAAEVDWVESDEVFRVRNSFTARLNGIAFGRLQGKAPLSAYQTYDWPSVWTHLAARAWEERGLRLLKLAGMGSVPEGSGFFRRRLHISPIVIPTPTITNGTKSKSTLFATGRSKCATSAPNKGSPAPRTPIPRITRVAIMQILKTFIPLYRPHSSVVLYVTPSDALWRAEVRVRSQSQRD